MMEEKIAPILTPVSNESEIKEAQNRIETSWGSVTSILQI